MTQENERLTEAGTQPEPELETPPAPEPEPPLINIRVRVPVATNDQLKALSELWGETKQGTATRMLIGFTQRQYSINKAQGRI
ncbi:hypothetical protein ES703_13912 [subsurface metagenome]